MICHCGKPCHRAYNSWYRAWMWSCTNHGVQGNFGPVDDQLTLEHEEGWK